jgi:hypothetical protein
LNLPKANGVSALGIAIHAKDHRILQILINAGCDVNQVSVPPNPGISAMSLAVKHRNEQAAELLL